MKKVLIVCLAGNCLLLNGMNRPLEEQPRDTRFTQEQGGLAAKELRAQQQEVTNQLSEQTQAHIQRIKEQANLGKLPDETLSKILVDLAKEKVRGATEEQRLYKSIATIRAFMDVFPQFYSDVATTGQIIEKLAKKYALDEIKVAIALTTDGAGKWLSELVRKQPEKIKAVGRVLINAAENNELAKVKFILQYVSNVVNQGELGGKTALIAASENGHVAVVERLLQVPGIRVNAPTQNGYTALIATAENGHVAVVERLLRVPGINMNAQNLYGFTALIVAARNGHAAVVERLLQVPGINVNAKTQVGHTALMWAAEYGNAAVVDRLLQVPGIHVNDQAQIGSTVLMIAAENGHVAVVERLLQVPGINVNAEDSYGYTALIWAAAKRHVAIVERLLKVPGINVNAMNRNGRTALSYALRLTSPQKDAIIKLLRDRGATK